jgi:hypothetical protein
MDRETLVNYIIAELGKNVPRNDIILDICEKTGVKWEQAERFVDSVEKEHEQQIKGG